MPVTDRGFLAYVSSRLAELPGVEAVSLGGSRAVGNHRPDSDWDFAIYYRGEFSPDHLRAIGWPGEVSEIGAWSPGVFNGGAWLRIDDHPVDVHYRDLDSVEHELSEARQGRFRYEPLMFHLAGIPTYLVVAELALNRVLHGTLPKPDYPEALRQNAPDAWWNMAELTFTYAKANHAPYGRLAQCLALTVQGASQAAHAVLAARGEWITNEKTLLSRAGLTEVNDIVARADNDSLGDTVAAVRDLCARTLDAARTASA